MYRFSRAIYRELADEVIEDPYGGLHLNHERVLKACEAAVERLATDRHYFAHPSRTLFNDIRMYFPMASQLRVLRVTQRYTPWIGGRVPPPPARRTGSTPMAIRSSVGRAPARAPMRADAAAAQRLLPVSSAPRRDRGDRDAARGLTATPGPRTPRRTEKSVFAPCSSASTSAGRSPTPCWRSTGA